MERRELSKTGAPIKKRLLVLDMLRGFALLGIILANFPEFSQWTFHSAEEQAVMPGAPTDKVLHYLLYVLVDGKFYTLFSLLFGIGFSMIITNCKKRGVNGMRVFYRRMFILVLIGAMHLLLLWSGDILLLYALLGMLLPLFWNCSNRQLLGWAAFFVLLPIGVDLIRSLSGWSLAEYPYNLWWAKCGEYGITEGNFATWLTDHNDYASMHQFLMQGAWERLWEFVSGNRYFKVLGLFLIGLYVGRQQMAESLPKFRPLLRKVAVFGFAAGLPLSFLYAADSISGGSSPSLHTLLYTFSVYPLGFAYAAALALLFERHQGLKIWKMLSYPGRMALTNYLSHSVAGIAIFYGVGFAFGGCSLWVTLIVALIVYSLLMLLSAVWMRFLQFGPLEWIWRMLTYGRYFKIRSEKGS